MREEKQEAVHHAAGDIETGALLVAQVCSVARTPCLRTSSVFLNQDRVFPPENKEGT